MESFKSRVIKTAIEAAKEYKKFFVDYEYLICSEAFSEKHFYIVDAYEDNFLHLLGVGTSLTPDEFFYKCLNGTLEEKDISFVKKGKDEKEVKGTVRRKIKVLPEINGIFNSTVFVEENFVKNHISCSFAVGDVVYTLGFSISPKTKPKTLLCGNMLNSEKSRKIDLVFRKPKGAPYFKELIYGDKEKITAYLSYIDFYIDTGNEKSED